MGDFCHMNFTSIFVKKAEGRRKTRQAGKKKDKAGKAGQVLDGTEAVERQK